MSLREAMEACRTMEDSSASNDTKTCTASVETDMKMQIMINGLENWIEILL